MCVPGSSTNFVPNIFILRRTDQDRSNMYIGLHVMYPLFLSYFNETWILATDFRKILRYQISWKILPVGAELFHADRQTDMTKLIDAFRNFANAPKNAQTFKRERVKDSEYQHFV